MQLFLEQLPKAWPEHEGGGREEGKQRRLQLWPLLPPPDPLKLLRTAREQPAAVVASSYPRLWWLLQQRLPLLLLPLPPRRLGSDQVWTPQTRPVRAESKWNSILFDTDLKTSRGMLSLHRDLPS